MTQGKHAFLQDVSSCTSLDTDNIQDQLASHLTQLCKEEHKGLVNIKQRSLTTALLADSPTPIQEAQS